MFKLPDFETLQFVGWVFLGLGMINFFVPFDNVKQKYRVGMVLSSIALTIFLINLIFNLI